METNKLLLIAFTIFLVFVLFLTAILTTNKVRIEAIQAGLQECQTAKYSVETMWKKECD
jgi:hypothetical protein